MKLPLYVFLSDIPPGTNPAVDFIRASTPNRTIPTWLYSWHDLANYLVYRKAGVPLRHAARRAFLAYRES